MIAKLSGLVDTVGTDFCIIDVGGVGYLVQGSSRTLGALPGQGEAARLHIETIVREDAITLYGFATVAERDMYRLLTSVQGVGAKVGLAILSALSPTEVENSIAAQDAKSITRANGVGPKLAQRIVNELKDKVAGIVAAAPKGVAVNGAAAPATSQAGIIGDAVSALVNLGYRPTEAHGAVVKAAKELGEDATLGKLVPAALRELSA
ncbi:Holliday junction branch migration protein RuvA [Pseudokordiimonas caeni]|uniref:Holliday junction branch migration protein RuvA n=1 Tax=Pseudokordiimonas caeni TaxID=2997908 RepID=UPI002811F3CA|nr:Holliday junction branch migration protein RuvA [Pseudokordiimonas caeni]